MERVTGAAVWAASSSPCAGVDFHDQHELRLVGGNSAANEAVYSPGA